MIDELDIINMYFKPLASGDFLLNNDVNSLPRLREDQQWVVTKDTLVENIDFFPDIDAKILAKRSLRVNLSDIAAAGAEPNCYFLSITFNSDLVDKNWIAQFAAGLAEDQNCFNITLKGGDITVHKAPLVISITMLGISSHKIIGRNNALNNDNLYVSGTIGDSYLAFQSLKDKSKQLSEDFLKRYFLPEPRIALGKRLVNIVSSAIDISDGLLKDLKQILKTSSIDGKYSLGSEIDLNKIPLSKEVSQSLYNKESSWQDILSWGDDYELLFSASTDLNCQNFYEEGKITQIGKINNTGNVTFLNNPGDDLFIDGHTYNILK